MSLSVDQDRAAIEALERRLDGRTAAIALVLGSGLGALADDIEDAVHIPFAELPGFPASSVSGHAARIVAGRLDGVPVLAFAGRLHLYEGHDPRTVTLPVRLAHAAGATTYFVSNAAGGIRPSLRPGDLMIIRDQLDFTCRNPLRASGIAMAPAAAYDGALAGVLRDAARDEGVRAAEGIYAAMLGPSYETPAEIRMLARAGADAVGMSTVPEVIAARALGMRVAGVSCITNAAAGLDASPLRHAEVLEVTRRSGADFRRLVRAFVRRAAAGAPLS